MALQEKNQKYENAKIDELLVYAVKSRKFVEISIDSNELIEYKNELDFVSWGVLNKKYDKKESENCKNCPYKKICGVENY